MMFAEICRFSCVADTQITKFMWYWLAELWLPCQCGFEC
jgi:hypothetical protein